MVLMLGAYLFCNKSGIVEIKKMKLFLETTNNKF